MLDSMITADDEKLLEYVLQLSIVEQEKQREAAEARTIIEEQEEAYIQSLLQDQEKRKT